MKTYEECKHECEPEIMLKCPQSPICNIHDLANCCSIHNDLIKTLDFNFLKNNDKPKRKV